MKHVGDAAIFDRSKRKVFASSRDADHSANRSDEKFFANTITFVTHEHARIKHRSGRINLELYKSEKYPSIFLYTTYRARDCPSMRFQRALRQKDGYYWAIVRYASIDARSNDRSDRTNGSTGTQRRYRTVSMCIGPCCTTPRPIYHS